MLNVLLLLHWGPFEDKAAAMQAQVSHSNSQVDVESLVSHVQLTVIKKI